MTEIFADTFYFLALVNPEDAAHTPARSASRNLPGKIVTTVWVLTEVGNTLSRRVHRPRFRALWRMLRGDPDVLILPASQRLFDRGLLLYLARRDKEWLVTDCISFLVMKERGIRDALTGDRHFEQAGFRALLKG